MSLRDILSPARVALQLPATSKKVLFQSLGNLLATDGSGIDPLAAFHGLNERERLGSTGIGEGVAIPHARIRGLPQAIGALAVLEQPVDYQAIDNRPVRLVFALLVPEEATTGHLQLLALLAKRFNNPAVRERMLRAKSAPELYNALVEESS
ncbi:MAG: PTS sugar transporter subunit IIA [Pseudomonadota bacterium]